jgi:hypothetical protein
VVDASRLGWRFNLFPSGWRWWYGEISLSSWWMRLRTTGGYHHVLCVWTELCVLTVDWWWWCHFKLEKKKLAEMVLIFLQVVHWGHSRRDTSCVEQLAFAFLYISIWILVGAACSWTFLVYFSWVGGCFNFLRQHCSSRSICQQLDQQCNQLARVARGALHRCTYTVRSTLATCTRGMIIMILRSIQTSPQVARSYLSINTGSRTRSANHLWPSTS